MLNTEELKFDANGLIPAIVVDAKSRNVLTLAYMNRESLSISLAEGRTCFWSRSRQELWRKGETSGNVQHIVNIKADCDRDALIVYVEKDGPAWKQTIYYPYLHASKYGRGVALNTALRASRHDTMDYSGVTDVESAAVWNDEEEELTILAVNRDLQEEIVLESDVRSFEGYELLEHIVLAHEEMTAVNSAPTAMPSSDNAVTGAEARLCAKGSLVVRMQ